MRDFNAEFGARIAELRKARGMTQTDVARHVAAHGHLWWQQTVQRVELGKRSVRVSELAALAGAVGVEPIALLNESQAPLLRTWARTAQVSPDAQHLVDYLGRQWERAELDLWQRLDERMVVPFRFLAEQFGPLREVPSAVSGVSGGDQ